MKLNGKTIFVHKDCKSLSIYAFFMVSKTDDFRYLIKGFKEEDEDSYKEFKSSPELAAIFEDIITEYRSTVSENAFAKEKALLQLNMARIKYSVLCKLMECYEDTGDTFFLKSMAPLGIKFYEEKPLGLQIDIILKKLIGMKNALNIKEAKYKNKYEKVVEGEEEEETENDMISNLERKALSLEIELELGYKVNIKKTSMLRWQNMITMSESKRKAYGRSKSNNR